MASVQDRDVHQDAKIALQHVTLQRDAVAASAADTKIGSFQPGFAFEIEKVQHFVGGVTANGSYMVKVGTTNALAAATVPVAATRGTAGLHATAANLQGDADDEINLHATTDGSGALADVTVIVTIRPRGLRNEPRV